MNIEHRIERLHDTQGLWPLQQHHHHYELQRWFPTIGAWIFVESWSHGAPDVTYLQDKLASIVLISSPRPAIARLIDCYSGSLLVALVDGNVWYKSPNVVW